MLHNFSPNSPKKFVCNCCDYKCCKKGDFNKHLLSNKHKSNEDGSKCNIKFSIADMSCNKCNKLYKSRVGLWRHKKICIDKEEELYLPIENSVLDSSSNEIKILTNLVLEIVKSNNELQKQNKELQKQVLDVCQKIQPITTTINNNSNSHSNSHSHLSSLISSRIGIEEPVPPSIESSRAQRRGSMDVLDSSRQYIMLYSDREHRQHPFYQHHHHQQHQHNYRDPPFYGAGSEVKLEIAMNASAIFNRTISPKIIPNND